MTLNNLLNQIDNVDLTTAMVAPTTNQTNLEVGTILVNTWGFGQTNINFYQVVRKTAKTVWVKEIAQNRNDNAAEMTYTTTPCAWDLLDDSEEETTRARILNEDGTLFVKWAGMDGTTEIWNGEAVWGSTWA